MRDDKEKLLDMVEAINKIQNYLASHELSSLNEVELAGILRYLEILGEASNSVGENCKSKNQEIPWKILKDFRNVLAHQYFDIDMKIVENVIKQHLPSLKDNLNKILKDFN